MENEPNRDNFENLVVERLKNGYLVKISTSFEDIQYAFSSFRQVLQFLKTLNI